MKLRVKNSDSLKKDLAVSGFTITELAGKVGVSKNYLGDVIRGNKTPSPKLARSIVRKLNSRLDSNYKISDIFFTISVEKFPQNCEKVS